MRSVTTHRAVALALTLGLASGQLTASAAVSDALVDRIIGQPTGTTRTPNINGINASGLNNPAATAFDAAGNLYVSDLINRRVLGYISPFTTDMVADLVIGQPDFNSNTLNNGGVSASSLAGPLGMTVSPAGDLWVADNDNHRVLEYDRPFETDTVADFVIGQPNFVTNAGVEEHPDAGSLYNPHSVAVDASGNVWVADAGNNRVLEYDRPLETLDRIADRVLGQPTFFDYGTDQEVVDAISFLIPTSVALDSRGNLWVADHLDNRVLEFDDPLRFDAVADRVLGQPNFASRAINYTGSVDAAGLLQPRTVALDANDNVYVADVSNSRVLLYVSPLATNDRIADRVFGQPDFNSGLPNNGGQTAQTMYTPAGVAVDAAGNVAVADFNNSRVLLLGTPTPLVTSAQVKVAKATRKPKLVVRGLGMVSGSAVVEVNGAPLAATKYKEVAADGTAHALVALDADFDARVPRGVRVRITVFDPQTGSRSAPIPFTR
jgi:sugar lactone lactonase YvrE